MSGRDWADLFLLVDFNTHDLVFLAQTRLSFRFFVFFLLFLLYIHVLCLILSLLHPCLLLLSSFLSGIGEGALSAVQGHFNPSHNVRLGWAAFFLATDRNSAIRSRVADIDRLSGLILRFICLACRRFIFMKATYSNILSHLSFFYFFYLFKMA